MKKQQLAIAAVLVIALGAGVFMWQKQGDQTQEQPKQEDTAKTDISTDIDTSDWKTYRNEEYGITFKYPENVTVKESFDSANILYINITFSPSMEMRIVLNDLGTEKYWYAKRAGLCTEVSVFGKQGETCGDAALSKKSRKEEYLSFVDNGACVNMGAVFFEPQYSNKGMNSMYVSCNGASGKASIDVFHRIYQSVNFTK